MYGTGKTVVHAGFGTYYDEFDDGSPRITEGYPLGVTFHSGLLKSHSSFRYCRQVAPLPARSQLSSGGWNPSARISTVQQ